MNPGETFFISDTHFGHKKILLLDPEQGKRWGNIEERDEEMVKLWNATVTPSDEVFHLGDLAFMARSRLRPLMGRLNGRKFLLMGNHDKYPASYYSEFFKVLRQPYPWRGRVALTHAPIHPMCLGGRWHTNIHGHTHKNIVRRGGFGGRAFKDPRYVNVAVEQTEFRPIHADEVMKGRPQ
jgi:calcineurin-like phosphoesterase family protein